MFRNPECGLSCGNGDRMGMLNSVVSSDISFTMSDGHLALETKNAMKEAIAFPLPVKNYPSILEYIRKPRHVSGKTFTINIFQTFLKFHGIQHHTVS